MIWCDKIKNDPFLHFKPTKKQFISVKDFKLIYCAKLVTQCLYFYLSRWYSYTSLSLFLSCFACGRDSLRPRAIRLLPRYGSRATSCEPVTGMWLLPPQEMRLIQFSHLLSAPRCLEYQIWLMELENIKVWYLFNPGIDTVRD